MARRALIFYGGWEGHTPADSAARVKDALAANDYSVDAEASMDCLNDPQRLASYDVIVPVWTMGELDKDKTKNLSAAVRDGVGLAGFHGGAGDAFRGNLTYEWMVGGHFVGHPYVGQYEVRLTGQSHPATEGMQNAFLYESEQYYMLIDPAVTVLAETTYDLDGQAVSMPVVWTRQWGKGRVFYSALGHVADEFDTYPPVLEMTVKGIQWAAGDEPAR